MIVRIRTLVLLLGLVASPAALGWGHEGHKLICALAEESLSDKAQAMVNQLVGAGAAIKDSSRSFAEACLWPDRVKSTSRQDTYEHHFINVPDDAQRIDIARDCPAMNCLAVGIQRALRYLAEPAKGRRAKARQAAALRYLGHYIGDLHQPLHVANASDWGGNGIRVSWLGKSSNLHAIWDYQLLRAMGFSHPDSLVHLAADVPKIRSVDVLAWMNESLALARSHAYLSHEGQLLASGMSLGMDYLNRNKPIVVDRIRLAAARLALLLNLLADGQQITAFTMQVE